MKIVRSRRSQKWSYCNRTSFPLE